MVFDRPVLLRRSAAANVAYALAVHGIGNPERRRRVEESLESTGLARFDDRPARPLSAGEKQRLELARAWDMQPEVLFLDEPTAHPDPAASREKIESTSCTDTVCTYMSHSAVVFTLKTKQTYIISPL